MPLLPHLMCSPIELSLVERRTFLEIVDTSPNKVFGCRPRASTEPFARYSREASSQGLPLRHWAEERCHKGAEYDEPLTPQSGVSTSLPFCEIPVEDNSRRGSGSSHQTAVNHCYRVADLASEESELDHLVDDRVEGTRGRGLVDQCVVSATAQIPLAPPGIFSRELVVPFSSKNEDSDAGPPSLSMPCSRLRSCELTVQDERTTLMLNGISTECTRDMLCGFLDCVLGSGYDFVYMPRGFRKRRNEAFGYAFLNSRCHEDARLAKKVLQGCSHRLICRDGIVLSAAWSDNCQGLAALVKRYRNSPVMHTDVPDECKPILLSGGHRVPFPTPTRQIRAARH